nr:PREDICTED: uncharacterized protein LOC109043331 [Bemisia tabaci]
MQHGRINIYYYYSFCATAFLIGIANASNNSQSADPYTNSNSLNHEAASPTIPPIIDFVSYMERINGSLKDDDFEYMLDYYNNKSSIALEYLHDFDSGNISRMLIEKAAYWSTPPVQFLEEMADLISLEKEQYSNVKGNYGSDPGQRVTFLRKKYNISAACEVPDCVSLSRVAYVFPHLGLTGERPIFVRKEMKQVDSTSPEEVLVVEPHVLRNPLFGGLIPLPSNPYYRNQVLNSETLKIIITVHLYYSRDILYRNETVPIRNQCIMLYRRMKKSLLSNARKVRLLKLYDVVKENTGDYYSGSRTRVEITTAYDHISTDFKSSIATWLYEYDSDHGENTI